MRNKPMPTGFPRKSFCMKVEDFGVAYCEVTVPDDLDIPLLPYRKEGKLIFPKGHFFGFYCTPELQKAEQLGYKIRIIYGYKFQPEYIFKDIVDVLYKIKQESERNSVEFLNAKLLLNGGLYGKTGQKREKEQVVMFPKSTIGLEPIDFFGEMPIYVRKTTSKAKHILPAIAAFVACYGRLKLYDCIEQAQKKGGSVYYCDTDAIATDVELPCGKELGDLKDEVPEGIEEAVFISPKMYAIKLSKPRVIIEDGKEKTITEFIKCKGFPKDLFSFQQFKDAYLSQDMSSFKYEREKFALPFESIRRNKSFVSMLKVRKSVKTRYDKRSVINNLMTSALVVSETEPVVNKHAYNGKIYIPAIT
jgi:hypothetical protein